MQKLGYRGKNTEKTIHRSKIKFTQMLQVFLCGCGLES